MGEDCSAKSSLQQAFTRQVVQIFSDRDYAECKTVGQLADIQDACLFTRAAPERSLPEADPGISLESIYASFLLLKRASKNTRLVNK
jgi:hypothetical protein